MTSRHLLPSLVALALLSCGTGDTRRAHATIDVTPMSLDFDARRANGDPQQLTLTNGDTAPLKVTAVEFRGASADTFVLDPPPPLEVAPGGSLTLTISFTDTSWRTAVLVLLSNADNAPRREVPLTLVHASDDADAGHEEPDAGEEEPDAGDEEPDAGTDEPDAGTDEPDAGEEVPAECQWTFGDETDLAPANGASDLAVAAHDDGFTVAWWNEDCAMQSRRVDLAAAPTELAVSGFSKSCNVLFGVNFAGAASAEGAVFFAQSESGFGQSIHLVDLRDAPTDESIDSGDDFSRLAATASAGGVAGLWRKKADGVSSVRVVRSGGDLPFAVKDSGLPTTDTSQHTLAPHGDGFAVAWQGDVEDRSPISGALLNAQGEVIAGSQKELSVGGTKNVLATLVRAQGGFAVAWTQETGDTRSVAVSLLSDALEQQAGDLQLGELGAAGVLGGSVTAAAAGSRVAVAYTPVDADGQPVELVLAGIDRVSGDLLGEARFSRATLDRWVKLASAASGDTVAIAFVDDDRVKVISATCQ